jgi:hypothetical protein
MAETEAQREARWAERDRKREETHAYYEVENTRRNEELAVIAAKGMVSEFIHGDSAEAMTIEDFLPWARVAIKALADEGIVFASMGPCDG